MTVHVIRLCSAFKGGKSCRFNTVNGMTVHVINSNVDVVVSGVKEFQYRKRYDSARNSEGRAAFAPPDTSFQYRKRYDSARNSSR